MKQLIVFFGVSLYLFLGEASIRLCTHSALDIKSHNIEYADNLIKAGKIRKWFSRNLGHEFDSVELTDFLGLASLSKQVRSSKDLDYENMDSHLRGVFAEISLQLFSHHFKINGDRISIGNNLHADYWTLSSFLGKRVITGFHEIKSRNGPKKLNSQVNGFYQRLFDPELEILIDDQVVDRKELYIQTKNKARSVESLVSHVQEILRNNLSLNDWIHENFGPEFMTIIVPMATKNHARWVKNIPNDNSSDKILYQKHYPMYLEDFLKLYMEFKRIYFPKIYSYNQSNSFTESSN